MKRNVILQTVVDRRRQRQQLC